MIQGFRVIRLNNISPFLGVVLGALMLSLVTLLNGQPFFFPDTTTYVREADAAVVWALGSRFATTWTDPSVATTFEQDFDASKTPAGMARDAHAATSTESIGSYSGAEHTNSLESGVILSGRSIYYGFLLYLGAISGGFWLTVITQALIVSYVLFVLSVRCFSLPINNFIILSLILGSVSTAPFFVGYLMPYIFAAITILVTGIFIAFWSNLRPLERVTLALILVFSVLSHLTHLVICISILAIYIGLSALRGFRNRYFRFASALTILACVTAGVVGEMAFDTALSKVTGISPITPPLIMARLINLGPGLEYLNEHCRDSHFIICQFRQQLPQPTDDFIWSHDPAVGVFAPASPQIKRALSDEQVAFAIRVFAFDPAGVLYNMMRAGISQLTTFGLFEFRYRANMPIRYWGGVQQTLAFRHGWVIDAISKIDYAVVVLSCLFLLLFGLARFYHGISLHTRVQIGDFASSKKLFLVLVGGGVIFNAIICGSFSTVHDHYQARVVWLVPLVAMLVIADVFRRPERGGQDAFRPDVMAQVVTHSRNWGKSNRQLCRSIGS